MAEALSTSFVSSREHLRLYLASFAGNADFAERTFDRVAYLILHHVLPPQADHILQPTYPKLIRLRNYFHRHVQVGRAMEVESASTKVVCSSVKGVVTGAICGLILALARNLKVMEDFYGGLYFYPRFQFFKDVLPFCFKGGARVGLFALASFGAVELARTKGFIEQPHNPQCYSSVGSGPWAILGVSRHADLPTVKKAYRKLALKFHPDKNRHLGPDEMRKVENTFREVQAAYEKIAGKEEFDATNNEMFTAEFFEMTERQAVNLAGAAQIALVVVTLGAFARS